MQNKKHFHGSSCTWVLRAALLLSSGCSRIRRRFRELKQGSHLWQSDFHTGKHWVHLSPKKRKGEKGILYSTCSGFCWPLIVINKIVISRWNVNRHLLFPASPSKWAFQKMKLIGVRLETRVFRLVCLVVEYWYCTVCACTFQSSLGVSSQLQKKWLNGQNSSKPEDVYQNSGHDTAGYCLPPARETPTWLAPSFCFAYFSQKGIKPISFPWNLHIFPQDSFSFHRTWIAVAELPMALDVVVVGRKIPW